MIGSGDPGRGGPFVFVVGEADRRRLRRRGLVAALALGVLAAAALADPAWLGVAPIVLEAAAAFALAVLLLALFGLVAGLSCLAQLAFLVWLVGLTCTLRTVADPRSRLWGVLGVGAFVAYLAARRRFGRGRVRPPGPGAPGPDGIVDTTVVEHPDRDGPGAPRRP